MTDKKMLIFGVNHFKLDETTAISRIIRHYKPDVILHELLDGRKYTKKDADELLSEGRINNDCGAYIGRILEIISEQNILGVGIDKRDKETLELPFNEKVAAKEEVMMTNIKSAYDKFEKIIVVIDDQHLRFTKGEELDSISPIVKAYQNKNDVEIIRSDYRKMDSDNRIITTISSWFQSDEEEAPKKEEQEVAQEGLNLSTEAAKGKRKKVQDYIIKYIGKIVKGKDNLNLYKNFFKSMNDKQFDAWMHDLRDGRVNLTVIIPNQGNEKVDLDNNLRLGKELGFDFFQHIRFGKSDTRPAYTTPNKYMILKFPIRRAAQLLSKKVSIPDHMRSIDALSGQVTGKHSKGAKLSNPEVQILTGLGLQKSVKELMKYRGGDTMAFNELETTCYNNGMATQAGTDAKLAGDYRAGVTSTKTLKIYFQGMMIKSTL